ncbi:MAG: protein kinase [Labilithrix sp.]|nr:protein kinase [Labilithrix sp.]
MGTNTGSPRMPAPGDVLLGRFRVESVIGEGGMGVVYGARQLAGDGPVAIKVLTPEASTHPEGIPRFVNEARATMTLTSPHVVKVFEAGTLDVGLPFIVMERLDGVDLGALVDQRGPLPVIEAVDYLIQAADAVAEAHARGIVHRDLKPSNLFLHARPGAPPIVKVLDFGVSKMANTGKAQPALTAPGTFLGSPHYMSPEQLKSARDVDARADIWSLGVILYELFTSRPPFDGNAFGELFINVLSGEIAPLRAARPDIPEALEQIVLRCLRRPRDERFEDLARLARALAPFASPEGARAAERVQSTAAPAPVAEAPEASARRSFGSTMVLGARPMAQASPPPHTGPVPQAGPHLHAGPPPQPSPSYPAIGPPGGPTAPRAPSFGATPPGPATPRSLDRGSSGELPRLAPSSPALPAFYAAAQAPQPTGSAANVWAGAPAKRRGPSAVVLAVAIGVLLVGLVGLVLLVLAVRARAHPTERHGEPPSHAPVVGERR